MPRFKQGWSERSRRAADSTARAGSGGVVLPIQMQYRQRLVNHKARLAEPFSRQSRYPSTRDARRRTARTIRTLRDTWRRRANRTSASTSSLIARFRMSSMLRMPSGGVSSVLSCLGAQVSCPHDSQACRPGHGTLDHTRCRCRRARSARDRAASCAGHRARPVIRTRCISRYVAPLVVSARSGRVAAARWTETIHKLGRTLDERTAAVA